MVTQVRTYGVGNSFICSRPRAVTNLKFILKIAVFSSSKIRNIYELPPVMWIRIDFMRIRIHKIWWMLIQIRIRSMKSPNWFQSIFKKLRKMKNSNLHLNIRDSTIVWHNGFLQMIRQDIWTNIRSDDGYSAIFISLSLMDIKFIHSANQKGILVRIIGFLQDKGPDI